MAGSNPYIIAEVGQAHEGSLGMAHAYIDAFAKTGVHAIKFQTHIAEAESSAHEPFRVKFSLQDPTRFDYWKRMEFSKEQWKGLKEHCENVGLEFLSSPFSIAAVDLLSEIGVQTFKVGSGEVSNHLLLNRLTKVAKRVYLSSGMSSFEELDAAYKLLVNAGVEVNVFQCTTAYPTQPEQWGIHLIEEFGRRYGNRVGFSDHSGNIYACLAAATAGASLFEFHVVFHKGMFGPDVSSSLDVDQVRALTEGIHQIKRALDVQVGKKSPDPTLNLIFGKSLALNKALEKGATIQLEDLETKKPGDQGIPANQYLRVLGKRLKRDMKQWDFLQLTDIEDEA
jgi:N-acetylneuraminate synthase